MVVNSYDLVIKVFLYVVLQFGIVSDFFEYSVDYVIEYGFNFIVRGIENVSMFCGVCVVFY